MEANNSHKKCILLNFEIMAKINHWKNISLCVEHVIVILYFRVIKCHVDCSLHFRYFLELNPRLQVEHPCTEMISNINLPAAQLIIAMGIPLHKIKSIRQMFGSDPFSMDRIEFKNPEILPRPSGHVISARITSENPDEGFKVIFSFSCKCPKQK